MKKFILYLLSIYLFIPISVFAYSDYIIASGKNIGIELNKEDKILTLSTCGSNSNQRMVIHAVLIEE